MSTSAFFRPLSKTELYNFFDEFGATEESVTKDVQTLKEWISKQPHLPVVEDDQWLINLLLKCKNSLEKTKSVIDLYYTNKALMPEVFRNQDPCTKEIEMVFRYCSVIPCPKLTLTGHRIVIFHIFDEFKNHVPSKENVMKMIQISFDLLHKLDPNRGIIVIHNAKNITPAFIAMITPLVRKFMNLTVKTIPFRYSEIYVANSSPFMESFIKFVRSFLPKKLNERFKIWSQEATKFTTILPKDVLPVDFGGEEKSLAELRDLWYEEVKRHREWLISCEQQMADLDKKPGYVRESREKVEFGIDGSFRQLAVD